MILIEVCLRNFVLLKQPDKANQDLIEIFIDISRALEKTVFLDDELVVLYYITKEYNFSNISRITGISVRAVPVHFANICNKMQKTLGNGYNTRLKGDI